MHRNSRYDILFEKVKIGPVTAPNRFYAVPHASGMGDIYPQASAEFRGMKAEGGWGTVCVEMTEIHPSSDILPYIMPKLFDDSDIGYHQRIIEKIKVHGSLAGVELAHGGHISSNLISREVPLGPSGNPFYGNYPVQAREMSKQDIKNVLKMQRNAALRAKQAGYDIIYVYASHGFALPQHFISRRWNRRSDEYGGSLENRVRFMKEMIEVTKEAAGDKCAVAVRFGVEDLLGEDGISAHEDGKGVIELLGEMPDLWDLNLSDWANDSVTSRFAKEGYQNEYISQIRSLTSKPIVGVGRFTSPDTMVSMVKKGLIDFVGGARPSIADPFLPSKINENKLDEIRECIGCNICVSGDLTHTSIRCTQNPTIGEEWRKDWHPEKIQSKKSDSSILIVGSGPTGLEATYQLAKRGYNITLVDSELELGGRVTKEAKLPGLSEWIRVKDYRELQIKQMYNVNIYLDNKLKADDILELGFNHILVATGSKWRRDGIGRSLYKPLPGYNQNNVLTPDDIISGTETSDKVIIFDDDHYYMGSTIAEKLASEGKSVTLVTPAALVSSWTENTMEQHRIQARLMALGVIFKTQQIPEFLNGNELGLCCVVTGNKQSIDCGTLIFVTSRKAEDGVYQELLTRQEEWNDNGILSVKCVGDSEAPSTIAAAVYAGHRYARELDEDLPETPYKREFREIKSLILPV